MARLLLLLLIIIIIIIIFFYIQDLQILCLADLEALWKSIAEHSNYRQTWIAELDTTLDQVENDRANLVCGSLAVTAFSA